MRFKADTRKPLMPELVASKDAGRPALQKIHLNTEASEVWVTDSYKAARFPVELDEGDTSGPIPVEALKASRKPPLKAVAASHGTSIRANEHVEVRHAFGADASEPYVTLPREKGDYTFPNLTRLWPERTAEFRIALNAKMLHDLARALGGDVVELRFTANDAGEPSALRPIFVRELSSHGDDAPSGLLMPIRMGS